MESQTEGESSRLGFPFRIPSLEIAVALLLAVVASSSYAREKPKRPQFRYVGGTEKLPEDCQGNLEVTSATLTFTCPQGSVTAPYASIILMQYRSDVSRKVRKMKFKWKVRPPGGGGKHNRYFTVLYTHQGATKAIVLEASPQAMRPYLAEIDLRAGKRVEVQSHEEYD
jgi:hypothetical protein